MLRHQMPLLKVNCPMGHFRSFLRYRRKPVSYFDTSAGFLADERRSGTVGFRSLAWPH